MIQIELIGLIVFVVSVIFGAGILFGRVNNHSAAIKELMDMVLEIKKDIAFIREKIGVIEGRLKLYSKNDIGN